MKGGNEKNGDYEAYEPLDSTANNVLKRFLLERSLAKHTVLDLLQGYYVENLWYRPPLCWKRLRSNYPNS